MLLRPLARHQTFGLLLALVPLAGLWGACQKATPKPAQETLAAIVPAEPEWLPLFNGQDLSGWTPKISGYAYGEDPDQHFRVADGMIQVRYPEQTNFDGRFGHLFFDTEFSNYNLLMEYRFVGEQCPGGAGWAWRNSGVMIHCQAPTSMRIDQDFPVCIEVQTLGSVGERTRSTANLCTPGTHVELDGKLHTQHCTDSRSEPAWGDDWVRLRVEVRGGDVIRHQLQGQTVLEYQHPVLDPGDRDAKRLIEAGAPTKLSSGFISLQSESHPVDFRRVDIQILD